MYEDIRKKLRDLKEIIHEKYNAEVIGIFGSYARGEEKEGSDVDLLVTFGEGADLIDSVGLSQFLEKKLSVRIDIVSEEGLREEIREGILKEAVAL